MSKPLGVKILFVQLCSSLIRFKNTYLARSFQIVQFQQILILCSYDSILKTTKKINQIFPKSILKLSFSFNS